MIRADVAFTPSGGDPAQAIADAVLKGLRDGGEHILKLARDRVPIEEGTLERSGRVTDDGEAVAAVSFDTPYAVRVHEDLGARHADGRQAKYLESAAAEGAQDVGRIVRAAVARASGGAA